MIDPQLLKLKPAKVRLIDIEGKNLGIYDWQEAVEISNRDGYDLILVNAKQEVPVVRLGDYQKYIYQKSKEKKKIVSEVKEVRINFNEALNDLERKAKMIDEFLKENHQVRIRMTLKGRQRLFPDLAKEKFNRIFPLLKMPYNIINPPTLKNSTIVSLIAKK